MSASATDIVETAFRTYLDQDRAAAEPLYADDFTFTSPQDDGIGKAEYFATCFPTVDRLRSQRMLHVIAAAEDLVLVHYECELASGERFRNMEAITVRDGLIRDVQVFFGGSPPQNT